MRELRYWFPRLMQLLRLHRVQCLAYWDFKEAHTLLNHLGWTIEGHLREHGPRRQDCILYAAVKGKEW